MKRFRFLLITGLSALLAWQCIDPPAEPIMPTWDVDVSLPLINRTYELEELVEKNPDILGVDENGVLIYSFSDTMYNEPVGDIIRLQPAPTDFSLEVGVYTLNPPAVDFDVPIGEYIALPGGYNGPSTGVPPVQISGDLPPIETMIYMIIESGWTSMLLHNDTGLPLQIPDGVTIVNSDDGTVVGNFTYDDVIEPGEIVESIIYLIETRVYHELEFEFTFESPAHENVNVPDDPEIHFRLHFDDLQVREAESQIPDQLLPSSFTGEVLLDDEMQITEAVFSHGGMILFIENTADIDLSATIVFPELVSRNDPAQLYRITDTIVSGETNVHQIDMREWMIRSATPVSSLTYDIDIEISGSSDEYYVFLSTDALRGELRLQDEPHHELVIERIEGIIPPTSYAVSEYFQVDIGDAANFFEGDVTFNDVRLNIGLHFDGGFDALANLRIVGENKNGVRDSVAIPVDQRRIVSQGWSSIVLDKSNSGIAEFISTFIPDFPDELYITGDLTVNPDSEPGFIDVNNALTTSVQFAVPFDIGIANGIVRDTLSIGKDDDDFDNENFDYVNFGRMYFETENGIPVEMELNINLLCSEGLVLRQIPVVGQPPIGIKAAPVDSEGRVTGTSGKDLRVLDLSRDDIQILREAEQTELVLSVKTNGGSETVVFTNQDAIHMRIFATFSMKADFN